MTTSCCIQSRVFSTEQADELKHWVRSLPRESFFQETSNQRRGICVNPPPSHRYENPNDSWYPVKFDANCQVTHESVTLPYSHYKNCKTLKKSVSIALKWMAEQCQWVNQTRSMAISIMQHHHLSEGQTTSPIRWHRDNSDRTLVVLLDREEQWCGGEFLFKKVQDEPQQFYPKHGYGVIFENNDTLHSVNSLTAKHNGVDRTILTIHEKSLVQ